MLSEDMQNIILDISPDSEYMSEFFGDPDKSHSNEVDRAIRTVLESTRLDHEAWHKKHPGKGHDQCPGHFYFIGRALKALLLAHSDDYTDGMAMAIISMVMVNTGKAGADIEHAIEDEKIPNIPAIENIKDPAIRERMRKLAPRMIKKKGRLSDEDFDELFGFTDEMPPREKMIEIARVLPYLSDAANLPPEVQEEADKIIELLEKKIG